jgi:hypothetical protein
MILSLSSFTVTLYKAILVGQAPSGRITKCVWRSACFSRLEALIGPLIFRYLRHLTMREASLFADVLGVLRV